METDKKLKLESDQEYLRLIEKKYSAIRKRSFKTRLELYLWKQLMITKGKSLNPINPSDFLEFEMSDEDIKKYEDSWQVEKNKNIEGTEITAVDFDTLINNWYEQNEESELLLEKYKKKYDEIYPKDEFKIFYKRNIEERKCVYCGISAMDIKTNWFFKTKRARGKEIEIDRINSNQEYKERNVLLACYWCNNAKSDEFTPDEFTNVGKAIKAVWNNRGNK